ncbi:MAG: hypothetical protein ACR2G4_01325 [Pyrinomonadaceae bacterium]
MVGIYDNSEEIIKNLVRVLGPYQILGYTDSNDTHLNVSNVMSMVEAENSKELMNYFSSKELFFDSSRHVIVKVDSINSISFLTGAINAILNSHIESLTVITDKDINALLAYGDTLETSRLDSLLSCGLFSVQPEFSLDTFTHLISHVN